jgi:peptide deformylase
MEVCIPKIGLFSPFCQGFGTATKIVETFHPGFFHIDDQIPKRYLTGMTIHVLGDPVLREKAVPIEEINDEIRALAREMLVFMKETDGIGLAAPQIGLSRRIFVLRADDGIDRVFINPQIIETSTETVGYEEGCLSIPGFYEDVVRPERVTVQAKNENGRRVTIEADGLLARIIQHENDHLDGVLFIDRISPDKKEKIEAKFFKKHGKKGA